MSLTDDWKEGKLDDGFYYVRFPNNETLILPYVGENIAYEFYNKKNDIEILCKAPSYEELQSLTYDLELAKKNGKYWFEAYQQCAISHAEAVKTIEELKHFDGKKVCAENEVLRLKIVELKNLLQESCVYLGYDDVMSTNKENKALQEKLSIAVGVLERYADESSWNDCEIDTIEESNIRDYNSHYGTNGFAEAQKALEKIKEIK